MNESNNVVELFPGIRDTTPQQQEGQEEFSYPEGMTKEDIIKTNLEYILLDIGTSVFAYLNMQYGIVTSGTTTQYKDISMILESFRSFLYRLYGIEHNLQSFVEEFIDAETSRIKEDVSSDIEIVSEENEDE